MKILTLILILLASTSASAMTCTPRGDGGFICQDDGDYTTCTRLPGGGVVCN